MRTALWKIAVLAFVAMCVQDVLSTCMVVFEARLNGPVAGAFDVAQWWTWLISSGLAIEEIVKSGWRSRRSLTIIGAVTFANCIGTVGGVAAARGLA